MFSKGSSGKIGLGIFFGCACTAFVFVLLSTPIGQFRSKRFENINGIELDRLSCVTYWGMKKDCTKSAYVLRSNEKMPCANDKHKSLMYTGGAFGIISTLFTFATVVTSGMALFNYPTRKATIAIALLSVGLLVIPWACTANIDLKGDCSKNAKDQCCDMWKYSAGFVMSIVAWCVQCVGTVCLIFL